MMNNKICSGFLIFTLVIIVAMGYFHRKRTSEQFQRSPSQIRRHLDSYDFLQGQNSIPPYALNYARLQAAASLEDKARHCDQTPGCVAFNHDGWMMADQHHYTVGEWQNCASCGLWIRRK